MDQLVFFLYLSGPARIFFVFITYAQTPPLNAHANVHSGTRS